MFRSTLRSVSAWWADFSDDILGADLEPSRDEERDLSWGDELGPSWSDELTPSWSDGQFSAAHDTGLLSRTGDVDPRWDDKLDARAHDTAHEMVVEHHLDHPHRRQLTSQRIRRPGRVPERPAYCLSPVRGREMSSAEQSLQR